MSNILAIDLGTSYITSSYFQQAQMVIIEKMPAVVQFGCMGNILIGEEALNRKIGNRENTIDSIKRFIGKSYKELEKELPKYTFGVITNKKKELLIDTFYSLEKPSKIVALLIKEIKERAEKKVGLKFEKVVLTIPASFTSSQRVELKKASEEIGLEVIKIINEPTAAILSYLYASGITSENFAVYNFGGGMFDFSVINFNRPYLKILSTYGDDKLGGLDLINEMVNLIITKFERLESISLNLETSLILKAELYEVAKNTVHELSTKTESLVNIQSVARSKDFKIIDMNLIITREEFEIAITPIIDKTIELMKNTLDTAVLDLKTLSKVLLIGGSSKIPLVKRKVELALYYYYNQKSIPLRYLPKIEANDKADDLVALGAAVQIGILQGEVGIYIKDIVTKALGITIYPSQFSPIIEKGVPLPANCSSTYTTVYNYQESLEVEVLQGGAKLSKDNDCLGTFRLKDIESARAGKPKILVKFNIDENGIFSVSAKDLKTGSYNDMLVEQASWKL